MTDLLREHWLALGVIVGVLGGVLWWAFRPVPPPVAPPRAPKGPREMRHTIIVPPEPPRPDPFPPTDDEPPRAA